MKGEGLHLPRVAGTCITCTVFTDQPTATSHYPPPPADYMAPEVERCPLKHRPEDNKHDRALAYTTAADVWSVGVLTYELLVGFTPIVTQQPHHHHHHDLPETPLDMAFAALGVGGERRRRRGPPVFTRDTLRFPVSVSGPARDFILSALAEHPSDRPTAVQLLRHPWLAAVRQRVQQQQQAPAHGAVTVQVRRPFCRALSLRVRGTSMHAAVFLRPNSNWLLAAAWRAWMATGMGAWPWPCACGDLGSACCRTVLSQQASGPEGRGLMHLCMCCWHAETCRLLTENKLTPVPRSTPAEAPGPAGFHPISASCALLLRRTEWTVDTAAFRRWTGPEG